MFETFYKKGRSAYLVELVIAKWVTVSEGTADVSLVPLIESDTDAITPKVFKNRIDAERHVAKLLNGGTTYEIVAYSIRRFKLTVPKKTG